jgi:hypothetical protein
MRKWQLHDVMWRRLASPLDSLSLSGRGGTRRLRAAALESLAYDRGSATVDRWRVDV